VSSFSVSELQIEKAVGEKGATETIAYIQYAPKESPQKT